MLSCLNPELSFIHIFTTNVLIVLLGFGHAQELCIFLEQVPQVEVLESHTVLVLEACIACIASILNNTFVQLEGLLGRLDRLYQVSHDRETILRFFRIEVLKEDLFC